MAKKKHAGNGDTVDMDAVYASLAADTGGDVLEDLEQVKYHIDTGNLATNFACSGKFITGGLPGSRITEGFGPEASGKSLIGSNVLFGTQRLNAWAVLLDCENASNGEFMKKVSHLNLKQVLRYAPTTLERCFRQIHVTTRQIRNLEKERGWDRRPITFVFDSLTQPPCERELRENNLPMDFSPAEWKKIVGRQEQPGERARIISAEMRKLQSMVAEQNVTVYLINQIRDKIGMLYGCFSGRSKVFLEDGSWMRIAKIVNQRLPVRVMSIDPESGQVSFRKVIDWHRNGKAGSVGEFLRIQFRRPFQNGKGSMTVTRNHMLFVPDGEGGVKEVAAGEVAVGSRLAVAQPQNLGYDQWQLVYGSILGDGSVRKIDNSRATACLRLSQGMAQADYLHHKATILSGLKGKTQVSDKFGRVCVDSVALAELEHLAHYRPEYRLPDEVLENLDLLGLAIWYMDDGTYGGSHKFHGSGRAMICCIKWKDRERLLPVLRRFGLEASLKPKGFAFDSENTLKLHRLIARYVPPCMWYKLHQSCHELYDFEPATAEQRWVWTEGEVLSVESFDHTVFPGDGMKFDLTVEGNHTYVVGGAFVHNSPETTPGGNAVKFYASLRFRTATRKKIEHKTLEMFAGINMEVKNVKNRTFRPFVKASEIKLYFDQGVDPLSGLLGCLEQAERVVMTSAGRWQVVEKYLPANLTEYKFQASKAENRVAKQVLLDCPALVDAASSEVVEEYLTAWGSGLAATESGDYSEKAVSFDRDGEPMEGATMDEALAEQEV